MRLEELADKIGATILTQQSRGGVEVERVYAGDKVSDLLNESSDHTLLVTSLVGPQLSRLTQLMDVPAVCLVKAAVPEAAMLAEADDNGTVVMVSPVDMFETCGRLYCCLDGKDRRSQ